MPIYDNNGTTNYEISKVYDNDGTSNYQIGKIFDHDGTNNYLTYTASVTLKNLLSGEMDVLGYWQDHGAWTSTHDGTALPTVSGHRYYVRAQSTISAAGCAHGYTGTYGRARAKFAGTTISTALNYQWVMDHAIIKATSNTTTPQLEIYREQSDQGNGHAYFYMVVDLTELEAATGVTYTADSFWSLIGSAVFYNTKEINI